MVSYKGNRYQIDVGVMDAHQRIRIEDDGEILLFYDTDTNELLAKYPVTVLDRYSNLKEIITEIGSLMLL